MAEVEAKLLPGQFGWFQEFIHDAAALVLDEGKEYLLQNRLDRVLLQHELSDYEELISRLKQGGDDQLDQHVIDALTTNESSFFRDGNPWQLLESTILPDLIERRSLTKHLNIWCAASSSGQEPFSLAMLLNERFPELSTWSIDLLATDISQAMIERCRSGRFTQAEISRGLPSAQLVKYFDKDGSTWVVRDEIRSMVRVQQLNLARPWWPMPRWDLILLRNVLIYFDLETKTDIVKRTERVLAPDGYLMLGTAETTTGLSSNLARQVGERVSYYTPS